MQSSLPITPDHFEDALREAEAYALRYGCLLCRGSSPTDRVMMFVPCQDRIQAFGGTPGRERRIIYGLCDGCHSRPDLTDRVEARFRAELSKAAR